MYKFSSKTEVNKKFKLSELFREIGANKKVIEDARAVKSVLLTNVLSKDTLNLDACDKVKEIYIFEIELSCSKVPQLFISALDRHIRLHTVFRFVFDGKECYGIAYKTVGSGSVSISKYYITDWKDIQDQQENLPIFYSIDDVYYDIITKTVGLSKREGEAIADYLARYDEITALTKEADKLERAILAEKQPNIVFELNRQVKEIRARINNLR